MLQVVDTWSTTEFDGGSPFIGYLDEGDNTNNSSCHLLSTYYVLGSLYTLLYPYNLGSRSNYQHFIGEDTQVWGSQVM